MNWRNLPDAPESVKYHGGYDPSNPPPFEDEPNTVACDCDHDSFPEEITEINGKTFCPNCKPENKI